MRVIDIFFFKQKTSYEVGISDCSSDVCSADLPMVDGWIGDDWFSYGAFRQDMFSYFTGQMTRRGRGVPIASAGYDDYTTLLRAGSASDYAKSIGLEQVPWWNKLTEHPAYDAFWQ